MKRYLACLFVAVALLAACEEKKNAQAYLDEASRLYMERFDDTAAIAALLSEGLATHPADMALLQFRADLYCGRGMLPECRADVRRLLELKPGHAEARMGLCMLDELEGVETRAVEACYRDAAASFAARASASSPDIKNANKFSYIFALLMARAPEAEKERDAFLESVKSDPSAWVYQGTLLDFDRKRALDEIFGQSSPENAMRNRKEAGS